MNNTIKLAVASALIAAASSASAAGGIVAGDWTLDIGGVVNAYYTNTKVKGNSDGNGTHFGGTTSTGTSTVSNITTGLLPNYLSVSGKTRQNDLDVAFTISINPGASTTNAGIQSAQQENRQAFLTFGDASWGSIKLGKDLGIYASDAILNDMTLLGVGAGAGHLAGNTTTLGRIGTGFMYADWKSQVAYTSPNFNGFQFTAGVTQAFGVNPTENNVADEARGGKEPAFEGKASYSFAADAVTGKVWASAISQNVESVNQNSSAWDLGANVSAAGFGLTGYYGEGRGTGTALQFNGAYDDNGAKRKSDDWYVQATYALPGVGTKLGASYGESTLKAAADDSDLAGNLKDSMWVVGVYHPITKHLNLVAEYSDAETKVTGVDDSKGTAKTMSLGAILFF
jgi:predicted porin